MTMSENDRNVPDEDDVDEWSEQKCAREINAEDPYLQQDFRFCHRPDAASCGKLVQMKVNCFQVTLNCTQNVIFKYRVEVRRSPQHGNEMSSDGENQQWPWLPRSLMQHLVKAVLHQIETTFSGLRVVYDGGSTLYAPDKLPWTPTTKTFKQIDPYTTQETRIVSSQALDRISRPARTFEAKVTLTDLISMSSLEDHFSNAAVNVMPLLQALDAVTRFSASQQLVRVGRNFIPIKTPLALKGGKESWWSYHQSLRLADQKLLMNVDRMSTVFYAPKGLLEVMLAALNWTSSAEICHLSYSQTKTVARALRKIEVAPTYRKDRWHAIFGISSKPANKTMVRINGETMSVAEYLTMRFGIQLKFPLLPCVNVGSKRAGKENWIPIELCQVAPWQRCAIFDQAEIAIQTDHTPCALKKFITDQMYQADFENDPYLAAFGVKVAAEMEKVDGRVLDPPTMQFKTISEQPMTGKWNLRDKRLVNGATLSNWGVVVIGNLDRAVVRDFICKLVDTAQKIGMDVEDDQPYIVNTDTDTQVTQHMQLCFNAMETRHKGVPQLMLVIKRDKSDGLYGVIKRMSDQVLGIPSQCVLLSSMRRTNPHICANLCLKINAKLGGKNVVLRDALPLVDTASTIFIGAVINTSLSSQFSVCALVASVDLHPAKYIARVAVEENGPSIQQLAGMLRELFFAYYKYTQSKPNHVVYYRFGVSGEKQMHESLTTEMRALRMTFKMLSEQYKPFVTFLVATKVHHLRAFPVIRAMLIAMAT